MSDEGVHAFCVCLFTLLGVDLNGGLLVPSHLPARTEEGNWFCDNVCCTNSGLCSKKVLYVMQLIIPATFR
jgi:hypothetical protein